MKFDTSSRCNSIELDRDGFDAERCDGCSREGSKARLTSPGLLDESSGRAVAATVGAAKKGKLNARNVSLAIKKRKRDHDQPNLLTI